LKIFIKPIKNSYKVILNLSFKDKNYHRLVQKKSAEELYLIKIWIWILQYILLKTWQIHAVT